MTPETKGQPEPVACRYRDHWGNCRCTPPCEVCGHGKHAAIHGPFIGEAPGSRPYGHEYVPSTEEAS